MLASSLPIKVELDADAGYYASHSRADIQRLAARIMKLNSAELRQFMPAIFTVGLMYPNWWFRQTLKFIQWKRKIDSHEAWKAILLQPRAESMLKEMQKQTAAHIIRGKDREEARSVGGWSQREINFASNLLAILDRHKMNEVMA